MGEMKTPIAAAFVLLAVGTALAVPRTKGSQDVCDFSDLDLDKMLDSIVNQLRPEYSQPNKKSQEVVPGVSIGAIVYLGLDKMRPYGPLLSYCRNGSRLVQVDLATEDSVVEAFMPWEACGGQKGRLITYAKARVTVTFKVVDASVDNNDIGFKLVYHSGPTPVSIEGVYTYLEGAGEVLGTAVTVLFDLFPMRPREFWIDVFKQKLGVILREISGLAH